MKPNSLIIILFTVLVAFFNSCNNYKIEENAMQKRTSNAFNDGFLKNNIRAMAIDNSGAIWFGTDKGVFEFDGKEWIYYKNITHHYCTKVVSIAIDSYGNKWFGVSGGGVAKFDGKKWKYYYHEAYNSNSLISNSLVSIASKPNGVMWFNTKYGISKFDGKNWTNYSYSDKTIDRDSNKELNYVADNEDIY